LIEPAAVFRAREKFLEGEDSPGLAMLPESVVKSWRRSRVAGVDATTVLAGVEVEERPATTLLRAARPVLEGLAERLNNTPSGIWLSDERGAIVDRVLCDPALTVPTDQIGAVPGFAFSEEIVGTNGIGTVLEEARPLVVVGGEHFAEAFNRLACAGAPIRHPVTRRLVGVLDVTCPAAIANELVLAIALEAAGAVERRLLEDASVVERLLLEHFLQASKSSRHGVVSLSSETVITNGVAARLLAGIDTVTLWEEVARVLRDGGSSAVLQLQSPEGHTLVAECQGLEMAGGEAFGGLLVIRQADRPEVTERRRRTRDLRLPDLVGVSSPWRALDHEAAEVAATEEHVLVTGERGVGKLALARAIAALRGVEPTVIEAVDSEVLGPADWLREVSRTIDGLDPTAVMIVTHLERLGADTLEALAGLLDGRPVPSLATAVLADANRAEAWSLDPAGVFTGRLHVPALRHRLEDLAPLGRHFDARHGAGRLVWSTNALQIMQRYFWPGNAREVEHLVKALISRLSPTAEITANDLPEEMRRAAVRRPLSRLEQAEVDVILAALSEANGNKEVAAQLIGMHRATLYRKIAGYGLDLDSHIF
jgi:sigma-54 dependent transcriptional regulator, acetoin dehydrogenase operon transcriptional activator AcoR